MQRNSKVVLQVAWYYKGWIQNDYEKSCSAGILNMIFVILYKLLCRNTSVQCPMSLLLFFSKAVLQMYVKTVMGMTKWSDHSTLLLRVVDSNYLEMCQVKCEEKMKAQGRTAWLLYLFNGPLHFRDHVHWVSKKLQFQFHKKSQKVPGFDNTMVECNDFWII